MNTYKESPLVVKYMNCTSLNIHYSGPVASIVCRNVLQFQVIYRYIHIVAIGI